MLLNEMNTVVRGLQNMKKKSLNILRRYFKALTTYQNQQNRTLLVSAVRLEDVPLNYCPVWGFMRYMGWTGGLTCVKFTFSTVSALSLSHR